MCSCLCVAIIGVVVVADFFAFFSSLKWLLEMIICSFDLLTLIGQTHISFRLVIHKCVLFVVVVVLCEKFVCSRMFIAMCVWIIFPQDFYPVCFRIHIYEIFIGCFLLDLWPKIKEKKKLHEIGISFLLVRSIIHFVGFSIKHNHFSFALSPPSTLSFSCWSRVFAFCWAAAAASDGIEIYFN